MDKLGKKCAPKARHRAFIILVIVQKSCTINTFKNEIF